MGSMVHCRGCGRQIHETARTCPECGAPQGTQSGSGGKSKVVAGVFALTLGGLGVHRFYLGQWWGLFYLLFVWTLVPSIVALVEGIAFLVADDEEWARKYG